MTRPSLLVIADLSPAARAELLPELIDRGHRVVPPQGGSLEQALRATAPDAVLMSSGAGLTAELIALCDQLAIRLVVVADSDAERRVALAVGIADVLPADAPCDTVERHLLGDLLGSGESRRPEEACPIVAVWGPAGAPGRSTIAVHLAAELARPGRSVLVIDADPYGGSVASRLGLIDEVPTFAAAARLTESNSFTRDEFDRLVQRFRGAGGEFWVLTGLTRPDRWPELSDRRVRRVLEACQRWVDLIVVDTGFCVESDEAIVSDVRGPRRNASTLAALDAASQVVVVGLCDPVGMARLIRGYADLPAAPGRPLHVVVNAVRSRAAGSGAPVQIRTTLRRFAGIREVTLIPDDRAALDSALLSGVLVHDVAPRSAFLAGVRRLVDSIEVPLSPSAAPARIRRGGRARRRATLRRRAEENAGERRT